jgi:TM2 domain-containing membrane protein YozV
MKRKLTAVLLSALVLPGLGQLYLGRKARGVVILLLVNLLMLLTVFVLLKGLAPVIASKMISGTFGAQDVLAALQGVTGFAQALLAGFALLWVYSIVDLVACRDSDAPAESR